MADEGTATMAELDDRLYRLAAYAKAKGWDDACGWVMRKMAEDERKGRKKRKRKVRVTDHLGRLASGGAFWIDPKRLEDAEEVERED